MLLSQRLAANQEMAPQEVQNKQNHIIHDKQKEYIFSESQNESDRFLEEVLLSRKPQYEK